jgi:hypothetical protein
VGAGARATIVRMEIDSGHRPLPAPDDHPDWVRALEMGIDVRLLEHNLRLTPEQRISQLEEMQRLFAAVHGRAVRR